MTKKAPPSRPRPAVRFAGRVSVVARKECRLERVWAPTRSREGLESARLQARQTLLGPSEVLFAEPPPSTSAGFVNIWICSRDDLPGRNEANPVWVPEPFLLEPASDGPRLLPCAEGFEGQIWQSRALVSTRWWPSLPDQSAWKAFIEGTDAGLGLPADEIDAWRSIPPVSQPGWRKNMSLFSLGSDAMQQVFSPARLAGLLLVMLAIPGGWLLGAELKTRQIINQLEAARIPLASLSQEVQEAQARAFDARSFADAMENAGRSTLLIDALTELKTAGAEANFTITFLRIKGDQIEVRLDGYPAEAVPALVSALDKSPMWQGVSGALNRTGEVVLKASISPAEAG